MFEAALVESRGQLGSPTVRWTTAGSILLQVGIAAVVVTIPLLRPQAMTILPRSQALVAPTPPRAAEPIVRTRAAENAASSAMSVPQLLARVESAAGRIRQLLPGTMGMSDPEPAGLGRMAMGGGPGIDVLSSLPGNGTGEAVVRAAHPEGPVRVSSGVSAGLLLTRIQPLYPAIARAARIQGTVVVEAVISKTGNVENPRAVTGPEMLRGAALDAIERARYKPFMLNGQAVAVQTTFAVNFRLGE